MSKTIKSIMVLASLVICACKPSNGSLTISKPPSPATTSPISNIQLNNWIAGQMPVSAQVEVMGTSYSLVDKSFIDDYSSWYWEDLNSLNLLYNIKTTNCLDFSMLYTSLSPIQASNSSHPEKAHLTVGVVIVKQINSAMGVDGDSSGRIFHAVNIWATIDNQLILCDPQSEKKELLKDYENKDYISKVYFF